LKSEKRRIFGLRRNYADFGHRLGGTCFGGTAKDFPNDRRDRPQVVWFFQ
jgi:hypothetical protein